MIWRIQISMIIKKIQSTHPAFRQTPPTIKSRFTLLNAGLYPETLPPSFNSSDAKRAFRGLVGRLDDEKFHERKTDFSRYSGTKHDGNRRLFGTPNIVSYFHISSFIWKNWSHFDKKFEQSAYSIGKPKVMADGSDRSVKVPSLSELSKHSSENISYAPFVLKADISQCFPSIYTHSISWAAHGIDKSKLDTNSDSKDNYFNSLEYFVRNGQKGNSRGVLIGPDAYRIIAEFILCQIDINIEEKINEKIIGGVRHVDDYYIGLKSEHEAQSVLSTISECLAGYNLNINDHKTKILSSLDPINDLWAQRLRSESKTLRINDTFENIERLISEAVNISNNIGSSSPLKVIIRCFDDYKTYRSENWKFIETYLQRICQKHAHAIDYCCLTVAKKFSEDRDSIDKEGWTNICESIIKKSISFNHDHEIIWMIWLLIFIEADISISLLESISKYRNEHVKALIIQAYVDGLIKRKPKISLGDKLNTTDSTWITSLVAKSQGYSKAKFSGLYTPEFEHLASRNIKLIDFKEHRDKLSVINTSAISHTRYGYDDDQQDEDNDFFW